MIRTNLRFEEFTNWPLYCIPKPEEWQESERARWTMDYITDIESRHKCAHEQCQCQIPITQEYCSDYCSDADDIEEVELQCDCKHEPCALN